MTDAPDAPPPDGAVPVAVNIDGAAVMVLIAENVWGSPRPEGVSAAELVAHMSPGVRAGVLAAALAVTAYICSCWAEALNAQSFELVRVEAGKAH